MKVSTACNHLKKAKAWLRGLYSLTKTYHLTQKEMLDHKYNAEIKAIKKKCPSWVAHYLNGMSEVMFWNLYEYNFIWMLEYNGKIYFRWDELPEEGKEHFRKTGGSGNHYWKDTVDTDNPKHF